MNKAGYEAMIAQVSAIKAQRITRIVNAPMNSSGSMVISLAWDMGLQAIPTSVGYGILHVP